MTPLQRLRDWAAKKADTDPDETLRSDWASIRDEVDAYLDPEGRAPGPLDEPLWGER